MQHKHCIIKTHHLLIFGVLVLLIGEAFASWNIPLNSCQALLPGNTYTLETDIKTTNSVCFQAAGSDIVLMGNGRTVLCAVTDAKGDKCKHAFDANGYTGISVEHLNTVGFQEGIRLHEESESIGNVVINNKNGVPVPQEIQQREVKQEEERPEEVKKRNEEHFRMRRRVGLEQEEQLLQHNELNFAAADSAFTNNPWANNDNNHDDFRYGYVKSEEDLRARQIRHVPIRRAPHRGANRWQRQQQAKILAEQQAAQVEAEAQAQQQEQPQYQPHEQAKQPQHEQAKQQEQQTQQQKQQQPVEESRCDVAELVKASSVREITLVPGESQIIDVAVAKANTRAKLSLSIMAPHDDVVPAGGQVVFYELDVSKYFANSADCSMQGTDHPLEYVAANPTTLAPLTYLSGFLLLILNADGKVEPIQSTELLNIKIQGVDSNVAIFHFDEGQRVWEAPHTDCAGVRADDAVDSSFNKDEGTLTVNTCQKGQFAIFSYAGFGNVADNQPEKTSRGIEFMALAPYVAVFVVVVILAGAAVFVVKKRSHKSAFLPYAPLINSPSSRTKKRRGSSQRSPKQSPQQPSRSPNALKLSQNVVNIAPSPLLTPSANKPNNNSNNYNNISYNNNNYNNVNRTLKSSGNFRASPKLAASPAMAPSPKIRRESSLKGLSL